MPGNEINDPKNNAFKNILLVPYQVPRKLGLSENIITLPWPSVTSKAEKQLNLDAIGGVLILKSNPLINMKKKSAIHEKKALNYP